MTSKVHGRSSQKLLDLSKKKLSATENHRFQAPRKNPCMLPGALSHAEMLKHLDVFLGQGYYLDLFQPPRGWGGVELDNWT